MYSDFYWQEQVSAFSVQVDLIKKSIYMKIANPKTVNQGWATWDWANALNYTVSFSELEKLTDEIMDVITGKVAGNVQRAYSNNSKIIAFGKSSNDNLFKCAIQNTTRDGSVVNSVFTFISMEDQSRFLELLNFLTKKKELFFMAEFIINASVNYIKAELYKTNKPSSSSGGGGGGNYNKNTTPTADLNNMFGGSNIPKQQPPSNVASAVNNVLGSFGGNTPQQPQQSQMPSNIPQSAIDELL